MKLGIVAFLTLPLRRQRLRQPLSSQAGRASPVDENLHVAISGGFIHLYTALDNGLFDKYGMKFENIFIRGSGPNLAALAGDDVQFTYCASDAIIPGMAAGIEAKSLRLLW